jgi:transposase
MGTETQVGKVIGLDVHPTMFSAACLCGLNAMEAKVEWVKDRVGLKDLERVLQRAVQAGDLVALEASGNSFKVAERLLAIGLRPVILESQAVGKVGKAYCATDRIDAIKIARVYLSGLARSVWIPDGKAAERRELFFLHRNAVRDSVRARNRIWAFLNGQCQRNPRGLKLAGKDALKALLALRSWTPMQKTVLEEQLQSFQHAEQQRKRLSARIAEEVSCNPDVLKMTRLLGIRDKVAFALAAFIGTITRFENPKKLVAFFGLNPIVSCSGKSGGNGPLSHYGRQDVRALLIQAAQSILRSGSGPTHKWAVALKMRKGANIAVAGLARKLVVSVWYLLQGAFTQLTEATPSIRIKIHKIVGEIGRPRIRQLGYSSSLAFEKEVLALLMRTA